jgi:hypothetical protein
MEGQVQQYLLQWQQWLTQAQDLPLARLRCGLLRCWKAALQTLPWRWRATVWGAALAWRCRAPEVPLWERPAEAVAGLAEAAVVPVESGAAMLAVEAHGCEQLEPKQGLEHPILLLP